MQEGSTRKKKKKRNERDHGSGVNKVRAVMWSIKMRYSSSETKKRKREREEEKHLKEQQNDSLSEMNA